VGDDLSGSVPAGVVALADYERLARERLDANALAYIDGGAGDESTLRANRSAWDAVTLWPRVLRPLAGGHTCVELLGRTLAWPLLIAPVAYQRLVHPLGELGTALAAAAQGAGMVVSTQSSVAVEEIARAVRDDAGRGPLWFQLYWQADRGVNRALVERAEAAGCEAIVLTVDAPVSGARDRERRAGFRLPPGISAVHLAEVAAAAPAAPSTATGPSTGPSIEGLMRQAPTWADVEWLRITTRLPLVLKGVLHPLDAQQAAALGADALIVSNHGGRTLDGAPATARALPRIADAIGDRMPLLVDGGIRRGTDIAKALALGARAVLIGRPAVHALAAAGPHGVAHALRLLRDEFEIALALTGCAHPAHLGRASIFEAD
jgi:4-hydroxymandelate oxidase